MKIPFSPSHLILLCLVGAVVSARAQTIAADYRVQDTFASSVGTIGPLVPVPSGTSGVSFYI